MAEGFEPYHVPQQSRRDKLRVGGCVDNLNQGCAGLLPLYDPSSLISTELLTCAGLHPHHNSQTSYQDLGNNPFFYAPQNLNLSFNNINGGSETQNYTTGTTTQGLSLSLSSSHHNNYMYGDDDKVTGGYVGLGSTSSDISRNNHHHHHHSNSNNNMLLPLGPFVGYATILKESRFSKPAEQLLQGICDVGCGIYAEKITSDSPLMDPPPLDGLTGTEFVDHPRTSRDGGEDRSKKSRLISMLDEVYRRYKQYYQQVQAVVASFESVPGLSNAAPYAHLALKAMNKHFGYLKNIITDQLQFAAKSSQGQIVSYGNDEASPKGIFGQKQIQNNNNQLLQGFNEHQPPVWRPQRGLPERAVTVLRAWLFEHFLHPYPTDTDKLMLAKQTGLSRNQVSNWFINARVRLWKPMVEEIHTLETRESQKNFQREDQSANSSRLVNNHFPQSTSSSVVMAAENPSTSSTQIVQDISLKRTRNVFLNNPMGIEEPMNLMYNNSLHNHNHHHHQEMGVGTSGVSLTLGLHQNNNGVVFSEPFPINAARRFGLDSNSDQGFGMGSFEGQNRQIGRNYMGGQLLHDFVG